MMLFTVVLRSDSRECFREWPILSRLEIFIAYDLLSPLMYDDDDYLSAYRPLTVLSILLKNKVEAISGTQETHPTRLCPPNKRSRSSMVDWERIMPKDRASVRFECHLSGLVQTVSMSPHHETCFRVGRCAFVFFRLTTSELRHRARACNFAPLLLGCWSIVVADNCNRARSDPPRPCRPRIFEEFPFKSEGKPPNLGGARAKRPFVRSFTILRTLVSGGWKLYKAASEESP